MIRCSLYDAAISTWQMRKASELGMSPSWGGGVPTGTPRTPANIAYAERCHISLTQPVRTHDIVRFVSYRFTWNPTH